VEKYKIFSKDDMIGLEGTLFKRWELKTNEGSKARSKENEGSEAHSKGGEGSEMHYIGDGRGHKGALKKT
jgi:hypothetical protein